MSSELYDMFNAEQRAEDGAPEHELKAIKSEIERITRRLENRLETPRNEEKRKRPKM